MATVASRAGKHETWPHIGAGSGSSASAAYATNGNLPPGVHFATWPELEDRLTFNPRRRRMLAGFRKACEELRKAGCRLVYLDGSFVTRKEQPDDFDACWDVQNVDDAKPDPVFWDFSQSRPKIPFLKGWNSQAETADWC